MYGKWERSHRQKTNGSLSRYTGAMPATKFLPVCCPSVAGYKGIHDCRDTGNMLLVTSNMLLVRATCPGDVNTALLLPLTIDTAVFACNLWRRSAVSAILHRNPNVNLSESYEEHQWEVDCESEKQRCQTHPLVPFVTKKWWRQYCSPASSTRESRGVTSAQHAPCHREKSGWCWWTCQGSRLWTDMPKDHFCQTVNRIKSLWIPETSRPISVAR